MCLYGLFVLCGLEVVGMYKFDLILTLAPSLEFILSPCRRRGGEGERPLYFTSCINLRTIGEIIINTIPETKA